MNPPNITKIDQVSPLVEKLSSLMGAGGDGAHISIYQEVGPTHGEAKQARIQFKKSITEIQNKLGAAGLDEGSVAKLVNDVGERLEDVKFWDNHGGGIAAFLSEDRSEILNIATPTGNCAIVGAQFHLKPIMALAANVDAFHLLLISQNSVALYRASKLGVWPVEVEEMPASYSDFIEMEGYQDGDNSKTAAVADSHTKADREQLKKFVRVVESAVTSFLSDSHWPLLVAGVKGYEAIYRELNNYHHLSSEYYSGNWDRTSIHTVYEGVHSRLHSDFIASQKRELLHYKESLDSGSAITDFGDVLNAVNDGKVSVLFVPHDENRWGRYDSENRKEIVADAPSLESSDLYEWAAREAIAKGGEVFFLQENQMPHDRKAIALLRWVD